MVTFLELRNTPFPTRLRTVNPTSIYDTNREIVAAEQTQRP